MPQSTNLNVNPYYSDFDNSKNYYKVLFKPGVSVQARELNNIQSILQDQIEKFGRGFYTNGGMVVPGGYAYDNTFNCIEVEDTYGGTSIDDYIENVIGYTLVGNTTKIKAKVEYILRKTDPESTRNTFCLYVKYQSSSTENFSKEVFDDGEELSIESDLEIGTTLFTSGTILFKVLSPTNRKATSVGSAAKIEDGVYFIRGYFVNVSKTTLILDPYTNTPSYRVGLKITESVIDSNEDISLVDNAKGFSNYAAPGADRLKIETDLIKKSLDDYNDDDFVELFKVQNGILTKTFSDSPYKWIDDILARRTFDESGNYFLNPYTVEPLESLNDRLGNNGLYFSGESTQQKSIPSKDLSVLKISPGKSYVKGYEVSTSTSIVDYPKPRKTKEVQSSSSSFIGGNILKVNNIKGSPKIGFSTNYYVTLYSSRLTNNAVGSATSIGFARVYDFEYDNNSYDNPSTVGNLYLYDIQTFTDLNVNSSIPSLTVGDYIKGKNSNASGFLRYNSGNSLSLYQVNGKFQENEELVVCGIGTTTKVSSTRDYSIDDIKSVFDENDFTSDLLLDKETKISGPFSLSVDSGIGTISKSDGTNFASAVLVDDIIKYSGIGLTVPIYSKVTAINSTKTTVTIGSISSVSAVCSGNLGVSTSLQSISIIRPKTFNTDDSSLYSSLENKNISEVSLLNSSIYVKKQYTVDISSNSVTLPNLANTDFVYSTFDEENYILVDSSGNNLKLQSSNFSFNLGFKSGTISGLSVSSSTPCKLTVTLIKSNVSSKYKKLDRCKSITLTRTKYSPASNGLTLSRVYGTRVEDEEISLNYPDIFEVHGVFQSSTSSNPVLPSITITGLNTSNLIVGEVLIGKTSGAVAICAEIISSSSFYIVYKNNNKFVSGETVEFTESKNSPTVSSVTEGDANILSDFEFNNGQNKQFYDFGKLIRKSISKEPSKRLKIVFDYFKFETTDSGDIVTVNSYPTELYGNKIPKVNDVRSTDIIDIRPRVADYSSNSLSPFDFRNRNFSNEYNNSAQILKSNESMIFDYSFYLPRTDKLTLSKDGTFSIVFGEDNEVPTTPKVTDEVLDIATIYSSAYVYDVTKDITISLTDNRRYTMSDIREIEKRIENLEYYTSLSLLELSTESLSITDSEGLNRFKSGFFVDNFGSYGSSDITNNSYKANIIDNSLTCTSNTERVSLYVNDFTNIKQKNNTLVLDYTEVEYAKQPFASRIINVNPFNIVTWTGKLEISPSSDYWTVSIDGGQTLVANVNRRGQVDTITTSNKIKYIRSRNIRFIGTRLKPSTQFDFYFDSRNLSSLSGGNTYAFPKLIEISNVVGTFSVGETVNGYDINGNRVSFRICTPNHKSGPYNNPTSTYTVNPYNPSVGISTLYGSQSTVLNIDTDSLQLTSEGSYYGNVTKGMTLYGTSSNATCLVSNLRLVTDNNGTVEGTIFIPDPSVSEYKFPTGRTTSKITTTQVSSGTPGDTVSSAEATFTSSGDEITTRTIGYYDPLAQTFTVPEENGIFPTSVDVYFQSKDSTIPVTLQIREVSSGLPGGNDKIVGNLEKVLMPSEVSISNDGSAATTFTFDNLTRLEGNKEYALVLLSDSNQYNVWISRVGEVEISSSNLPEIEKVIINKQPSLGSLFTSQNGSTWTPTQEDDLKFTIKKAKFTTSTGVVRLFNSDQKTNQLSNKLPNNPITTYPNTSRTQYHNGRYILVNHPNHGMYSENNSVEIKGVFPDSLPVKLSAEYSITSTSNIQIPSGQESNFTNFNGLTVSVSEPGYILINDEIIKYTGTSSGQITGIERGQLGTKSITHPANSLIYRYDFNGVSLARINKTFDQIYSPSLDSYYVQIDDDTYFATEYFGGGSNVYASRNIQFSQLSFDENFVDQYEKTSVSSTLRTVLSTSVNGSESSFKDNGFETVGISSTNFFRTPRMVCSKLNETVHLPSSQFNSNKSMTVELTMNTQDENVSPLINTQNASVFLDNNRINSPINLSSYSSDSRVNSNDDPTAFIYISKKIDLSETASSLKVLLSAYRHPSSDIRVLYKVYRDDSTEDVNTWNLFPGYLNINNNGEVINEDNNDGRPDKNVRESLDNEFLEYSFTMDNIPQFSSFAIKIVGTSTNQSFSPIIKDLRVIALR